MATLEFIQKRIAGKEKEIEKLTKKMARIEKAKESNWEENNPYMYSEYDLRITTRELKEAHEGLEKYRQQLQQEQEKANSRNVAAILEFLDGWKTRMFNFYNEGLTAAYAEKAAVQALGKKTDSFEWGTEEYKAAKAEYEARHKAYRNKLHGYFRDLTPEERKLPHNRYKRTVKVREGEWEFLKDYFSGSYEESIAKLQKDLEQEANRKYDFIIERTNRIVGQITDASGLRVGNKDDLNGFIKGTKGTAKVQTIGAGGYAVQCFHFRTLINKAN